MLGYPATACVTLPATTTTTTTAAAAGSHCMPCCRFMAKAQHGQKRFKIFLACRCLLLDCYASCCRHQRDCQCPSHCCSCCLLLAAFSSCSLHLLHLLKASAFAGDELKCFAMSFITPNRQPKGALSDDSLDSLHKRNKSQDTCEAHAVSLNRPSAVCHPVH